MSKNEKTTITINWSQVATSLLIGGIVGAITILRLADSNTIIIASNTKEIEELKTLSLSRSEFQSYNESFRELVEEKFNHLEEQLDRIEQSLD